MAPSSDESSFRATLASAKRVVILAGAGLSAGSGIPTYRGEDGVWTKNDIAAVGVKGAFESDPSLVWKFHHPRRELCFNAQPNAAHRALAALALHGTRERVLPCLEPDLPPLFVTQNFDTLSPRALKALSDQMTTQEMQIAENRLIEMHGSAARTICTQCKHINTSFDSPLSPALVSPTPDIPIPIDQLPRCGGASWNGSNRYGRCGGLLRPAVTTFGEIPDGMGEIARELNWTDVLIVVGTSSLVHPAASFAKTVRDRGGKVAVFNMHRTREDDLANFLFLGPCEETLPKALGIE